MFWNDVNPIFFCPSLSSNAKLPIKLGALGSKKNIFSVRSEHRICRIYSAARFSFLLFLRGITNFKNERQINVSAKFYSFELIWIECIKDLDSALVKVAKWLLLGHFWSLLLWGAGCVLKCVYTRRSTFWCMHFQFLNRKISIQNAMLCVFTLVTNLGLA